MRVLLGVLSFEPPSTIRSPSGAGIQETTMTRTVHAAAAAAGLALFTLPVLVPVAVADTSPSRTKAQIEHEEQRASIDAINPSKAQIEQRERQQNSAGEGQGTAPSTPVSSGAGDAAAWQLALSAALGATLMGGIVLVSRQVTQHRHAVAQ
jgi:hypothetical protein